MTDRFEEQLRQLQPRGASPDIRARIQAALEVSAVAGPRSGAWGDRCLLSVLSMGAAAGLLIATLLLLDARHPAAETPMATSPTAQHQTRDYLTQLAGGKDLPPVGMH